MLREQCRVGMTVTFGRVHGDKTVGVVEKMNTKTAKVRSSVARGVHPAGTVWNVYYTLLNAEGTDATAVHQQDAFPIGQRIVGVRELTPLELNYAGWEQGAYACALVLSDGSIIYASRDYEGNGPGAMFGRLRTGESFVVSPSEVPA